MRRRRSTPEQIAARRQRVAELSATGMPIHQVAATLNISESVCIKDRRALGLTVAKSHPTRLRAWQIEHARRRIVDEGANVEHVAAELGVSRSVLYRRFSNTRTTNLKRIPDSVIETAWNKVQSGEYRHLREAAEAVGISDETLRRRLKESGLRIPPRRGANVADFDDTVPCPHGCGRFAHPLPAEATSILGWPACEGGTAQDVAA
ncbi:hypothetical protein [Gordonia sp. (in: high G+C Gram-positive bacteria)]|uniref:hypothetical protein n=1 Tax=Gordonia sp. (in: high G+C Gram-positive bacteria) TaxID=84139 RepID=UPI003F9E5866